VKRGAPGPPIGGALADVGRARRFEAGEGRELWRFASADRGVAERLLRLGAQGLGGFVEGGEDPDGVWLFRATGASLSDWWKQPRAWRDVVALVGSVARALGAAEAESLFPGPLSPRAIVVTDERTPFVRADPLVDALAGRASSTSSDSASVRWIAPEQARGAPWDNAANRYVLGLLAYRGLTGEHPFGARGLRLGLDEQAERAPPPFPDDIARELPPGLQSLCLKLLDPDPRKRPKSADDIAERLDGLVRERAAPPARPLPRAEESAEPPREAAPARRPPLARRLGPFVPVLVGAALLAAAVAAIGKAPEHGREALRRPVLTSSTLRAEDCASCHPRQAGEWHRSVMAHAAKSPMFQALEILVEEQVGRDDRCPEGAGILRIADPRTACRDRVSGLPVTGSGGEHWCVNCHTPTQNLTREMPAWDGTSVTSDTRRPLVDLLGGPAMEGISCGFCHTAHGPVGASGYRGNPFWQSTRTGERFPTRPEDRRGLFGISNSGYLLDLSEILPTVDADLLGGVHPRPTAAARAYLGTSEFCGACHDVRLFGSDVIGARKGEHFKRLRNAYSEWAAWAEQERRAGRRPASCQDCHMSSYPGVCEPGSGSGSDGCPVGTRFSPKPPGAYPSGLVATTSARQTEVRPHYFSGVDLPLTPRLPTALLDEPTLDGFGIPLGLSERRDLLLRASVRLALDLRVAGSGRLEVPLVVENVGAGHRVPAGFSQERELWVHLTVTDARGEVVYEVGRVDRDDQDLRDKRFLRITTDDRFLDGQGRPLGLFGADVADGPDVPRWSPSPRNGGSEFRGRGLVNFQNGFLRCVVCIGVVDAAGRCQPLPGQDLTRAGRYADGAYDPDTGECRSNLAGDEALLETYFPIGALDATRGIVKGPDAIIDTRSLPPGVPVRYVYELDTRGHPPPFRAKAELLFRAFPPYLLRAFAEYEASKARAGHRPSGPLLGPESFARNRIVRIGEASAVSR